MTLVLITGLLLMATQVQADRFTTDTDTAIREDQGMDRQARPIITMNITITTTTMFIFMNIITNTTTAIAINTSTVTHMVLSIC